MRCVTPFLKTSHSGYPARSSADDKSHSCGSDPCERSKCHRGTCLTADLLSPCIFLLSRCSQSCIRWREAGPGPEAISITSSRGVRTVSTDPRGLTLDDAAAPLDEAPVSTEGDACVAAAAGGGAGDLLEMRWRLAAASIAQPTPAAHKRTSSKPCRIADSESVPRGSELIVDPAQFCFS